jgi:signal peptidase I
MQNPYSAPLTRGIDAPTSRHPWVAVALALLAPPIAMLFVGQPLPALGYLGAALLGVAAVMLLAMKGLADPNVLSAVFSLLLRLVAAVDAHRLARAWQGAPLPRYARAPALAGFLAAGFLVLLSVRAFFVEPFHIPSGAMEPTLRVGDHILADKLAYRWKLPFDGRTLVRLGSPERGDVAVFLYPENPALPYVKRVVGLPGDTVAYQSKRLSINGKELPRTEVAHETLLDARESSHGLIRYRETLDERAHSILLDPQAPPYQAIGVRAFTGRQDCRYDEAGFVCKVPEGHYFVMGDNRDHSSDSRYWGFVPEAKLVGRAWLIYYSAREPATGGRTVE